ncbi:MAG: hypothetical protein ACNA8R_12085 [Nitriliruptoraceae bacterium]
MTKALLGARFGPTELALLDEVRRLRARVAELEAELADRRAGAELVGPVAASDAQVRAPAVP